MSYIRKRETTLKINKQGLDFNRLLCIILLGLNMENVMHK